jgi:hypothetical protein
LSLPQGLFNTQALFIHADHELQIIDAIKIKVGGKENENLVAGGFEALQMAVC